MQKPYRFLVERVASYAEEGAAFLRRRRLRARTFARVWRPDGTIEVLEPDSPTGEELYGAARRLLTAHPDDGGETEAADGGAEDSSSAAS